HHIYARSKAAFAAGDSARDALLTPAAVVERQKALREHLFASLGGLPDLTTPLNARTTGVVLGDGFHVEKVIFQSRPRHYVTASLYLPDGLGDPRGAVLFLCGHHKDAKHQPEYQSVCQALVHAGLIVLAQDPIGQGERFSYWDTSRQQCIVEWGCPEHDHAGAQCLPLGDTIARYFLHDAIRSVDYLQSRPEVDASRIGLTGNSGGGTQSSLLMMAEPRLAAAAPATFIMNRESYLDAGGAQDAEQIWPGFTAAGYDHEDILLAMAPRPVRVLSVTSDFFPIEGARRTVQRSRRIWDLFGRSADCDLVEDNSTHRFTPRLAAAAAEFFARHLGTTGDHRSIVPLDPPKLWCTQSGQVRGEIRDAEFVFEANQERLQQMEAARFALPDRERRERAERWLRDRVFRNRKPCDFNPRFYHDGRVENMRSQAAFWWSQEGLFNHGILFRESGRDNDRLPVTVAVWDGGAGCLHPHSDWIQRTCASGRAVFVLDVSGAGATSPRPITATPTDALYGTIHKLSTDLIWLDDDLVSLRTFDVLRCLELLEQWPGVDSSGVDGYGSGRHGLYLRLAAALDSKLRAVQVEDGLESYASWIRSREYESRDIYSVIMPGVLHYFDLRELDEIAAARRAGSQ
ncbi:MAG: hypothetical protein LC772_02815, partial [Chloroflexi bacterium]|nr:hypothetical protein [Chloroflexota bacterium]